ncbi:hypothetical protein [Kaistella faecalis]|uniref:hypothetical protein n=1 Tax=Kaistella faecalis TaxID=2852098 RepID=UPI001C46A34C|nr:hypothetical protein [Chryseobacterium faecale]UFK98823.1 hypothetical protein LL667_05590 [Chryseobacterium faecale]
MINLITTSAPANPKYRAEYKSIDGDSIRLDIWDKDYTGEIIEIQGKARHAYSERKDIFQPVVPSTLDISLEANEDLTLTDLYSENERQFTVNFYRNNQIIFLGYLLPDGIWEDFVSNRWEISLNAMDGLSILKNLSFVTDEGNKYKGKITQFTALRQCLKRIGYELPINISNSLPTYEGFTGIDTVLKSVKMNADRFYQDDNRRDLMDCDEVLKSILELYNATIIQMHGEWWIYRTIDVKGEMTFYRYENGEKTGDIVWNTELNIGSHIDQYPIFHVNANQKKSIIPSNQAFRVHYKYGTVRSLIGNPDIKTNGVLSADGFSISSPEGAVINNPSGSGLIINSLFTGIQEIIRVNPSPTVKLNDLLNVLINIRSGDKPLTAHVRLETDNYFFKSNEGIWKSKTAPDDGFYGFVVVDSVNINENIQINISLPPILEDSNLLVILKIYGGAGNFTSSPTVYIDSFDIVPNANGNLKGEFHTAQRMTRISSVTKNDKVVNNGDSISDIYYGTLYKENGEPTQLWSRHDEVTGKPLLRIMVEDILRIAPRPMYYFEGDLYGYYPYLSKIQINNIPGVFQVAKYSFDTVRNINKNTFIEYATEYLTEGTDFTYEPTLDHGAVTKVTIVK